MADTQPKPGGTRASSAALWLGSGALYLALALLYARSLDYGARSLDDASQLAIAAQQAPAELLKADRYGHVRPIKSALFWLLARHEAAWPAVRAGLLVVLALATALVQRCATRITGSAATGLLAAACWALHPMIAAVACWLSAATTALAMVFVLLFLEHARLAGSAQRAGRSRAWLALAALDLALALLSHELAVVAPALLAMQLWLSPARQRSARLLVGMACAIVALWLALALSAGELRVLYRFADQPAWAVALSSARYIARLALMWLWPAGRFGVLLGDRPLEHVGASAAAWLVLALVVALAWKYRAREPVIFFGLGWFLVAIAPVANVVPLGNTPIAMHYLFMPSFGLALIVAHGSAALARRLWPRRGSAWQLALPITLVAAWLPETSRAVAAWGDDEALFARSAASYPGEIEPLVNLASVQIERRRYAQAEATLTRAYALAPNDPGVLRNRFALLWQTEQLPAALELLDGHPALASRPEFQLGRGQALVRLGRMAEAVAPLERALAAPSAELDEDLRVGAGLSLALALAQTGRMAEAQRALAGLLEQYPARPELRSAAQLLQR